MKINLTKDQFRDLLALVYLGEWLVNTYEKDKRRFVLEKTQQRLYGLASDNGCGDWIAHDPREKRLVPTAAMDKALSPFIDLYDENVFWDQLAERLAERDLIRDRGHDAVHEMDDAAYDAALRPYLDRWWDKIDRHGLDRLTTDNNGKA
ncbi:MAG: hypothetical protein QME74_04520 [Candidatus Edwardsbacteria bacterium]|nr:hypothetical protein [Candidatus Edwardsbacteria bacterium]